ncbi:hypothetical protein [Microbacterium sp. E-13]|uniref:hypothetical protein n=1 Tax=Microbacterium sp. E-13 TaxID=3404048 RepID=UPI003CEFE86B
MGINRTDLPVDTNFTRVPNAWLRDKRLSRRARGLLAELMSHEVGWHVSVASLQKSGTEGRDAIRSAIDELRAAGYLRLSQSRGERGRFNEVEYELAPPFTADGKSDTGGFAASGESDIGGSTDVGDAASGSAASGPTDSGGSAPKKTIEREDHPSEDHSPVDHSQEPRARVIDLFEVFWSTYPKRANKPTAKAAWSRATAHADAQLIIAGARAWAEDPFLEEVKFLPSPERWLDGERWNDDPPQRELSRMEQNLAVIARLEAQERAAANIFTVQPNSDCGPGNHRFTADGFTCSRCEYRNRGELVS